MSFKPFPILFFLLAVLCNWDISSGWAQTPSNSVLASGDWYKIAVDQAGVYKLDYEFFKNAGIAIDNIDPKTISIWGNGGQILPQANAADRPNDLIQNHIYVAGESDGKFDQQDYVLFFAPGKDIYQYQPTAQSFFYQNHLYANNSYYFIHIGSEGLRLPIQDDLGNDLPVVTTYTERTAHEKEEINFLSSLVGGSGSGREWFEYISEGAGQHTVSFATPGLITNKNIQLISAVMAKAYDSPAQFNVSINGQVLGQQSIEPLSYSRYALKARHKSDTLSINSSELGNKSTLEVKLDFQPSGAKNTEAYLDHLLLSYTRELKIYDGQTIFRSVESVDNSLSTFKISNANASAMIWEVTDPLHPKRQNYSLNNNQALFGTETNTLKEFVVFDPSSRPAPAFISKIANQNLHGLSTPDFVIVVPAEFEAQANRLADLRRSHDQLDVAVVRLEQIYNEFSSGAQDVTAIRDFVRYLYLNNPEKLKYLLLFGDCSYDYKDRLQDNSNWVPTYESRESLHPLFSYSSDDFFGFMEEFEGEWAEDQYKMTDHTLEIGVGRFPVQSADEAKAIVDKVIHYTTSPDAVGPWRQQVTFVADDGDGNIHQHDTEELAESFHENHPEYAVRKIYLDNYKQIARPSGEASPETNQAITQAIEKGSLIVNFIGHGSETFWTQEKILDITDYNSWENYDRLPLLVTATCEFGRYDDPEKKSGAEYILLNDKGGAIALVTTTRPVSGDVNFSINQAFYRSVFQENDVNSTLRLGDIFKETKNTSISNSYNKLTHRNFSLLGDPSLTISNTKQRIELSSINGKPLGSDTLKALQKIVLNGQILNTSGQTDLEFDGEVEIELRAKPAVRQTIGSTDAAMQYIDRANKLFKGKASVKQGEFELECIIPKNINYRPGPIEIASFAYQENSLKNASGITNNIIVGGSVNAQDDEKAPQIKLFLNDTTYQKGAVTDENSTLIARFFDENGINISSSGFGQDIIATLDDEQSFILNDYYKAALNTFQLGWVEFPLNKLEEGWHTLTLKAWDTHGNPAEEKMDFLVASNAEIVVEELVNYPNPFAELTNFSFKHNQAGMPLTVIVDIYDMQGQLVRTLQKEYAESPASIQDIQWNGTNQNGAQLGKGMYIYKVTVVLKKTNIKNQYFQKLVLIN